MEDDVPFQRGVGFPKDMKLCQRESQQSKVIFSEDNIDNYTAELLNLSSHVVHQPETFETISGTSNCVLAIQLGLEAYSE